MVRKILISFGLVYFWFGFLKFFPGISPAETLAGETIHLMTFGILSPKLSNIILAVLECSIGICLIGNFFTKPILRIMVLHLICTFSPLFLMPDAVFTEFPFALTLTGQYIIKNIVFITTAIFILQGLKQKSQGERSFKSIILAPRKTVSNFLTTLF